MIISSLTNAFTFVHALDLWSAEKYPPGSSEDSSCLFSISKRPSALSIEVVVIADGNRYRKASNKEEMIQFLWDKALIELQELVSRYQRSDAHEQDRAQRRYDARRIQVFCETNSLFAHFLSDDALHQSIVKVNACFERECGKRLFNAPSIESLCRLREAYAASCLDGLTRSTCPITILRALITHDSLNEPEEEIVKGWIEAVLDQKFYVTPLLLHRALRFWFEDTKQLERLIRCLELRGLSLLRDEDEVWNSFIMRLHPGMIVARDDKGEIFLGERRAQQNLYECHLESYSLRRKEGSNVEDNEFESDNLVVAKRPGAFLFYSQMEKSNTWGLKLPTLKPLGISGLFAISEHVETTFLEIDWNGVKDLSHICGRKLQVFTEIIKLVSWLKEKTIRPKNFSAANIGITTGGSLVLQGPLDLDKSERMTPSWLEELVKEGSNGNIFVFSLIMRSSGLGFHRTLENKRTAVVQGVYKQIKEKGLPQETDSDGMVSFYYSVWKRIFDEKRIPLNEYRWPALSDSIFVALEAVLKEYLISGTGWLETETLIRNRLESSKTPDPRHEAASQHVPAQRVAVTDEYTV